VDNYYKILGVKQTASIAEIKTAYRRLARERHPDHNGGSEDAAREFALLALAYRTLSDPQERAAYDAQRERERWKGRVNPAAAASSVLHSDNIHARRARMVAAQARYDRVVDLWLEADRRETSERSQVVFTTVTLFLSTFIVAMLKPKFWQSFNGLTGRTIVVALFVLGLWHLLSRLREYLERYTYQPPPVEYSIMNGVESQDKPFTRSKAFSFLIVGYLISVAAGLLAGAHAEYIIGDLAIFFDQHIRPDLVFYPPIAVLIVDTMHTFASKIDS
jgi:hypothetical protein